MTDMDTKKTIFVAMPFGTRSGFLHHSEEDESKRKTIKFDGVWKGIIEKSLPDEVEAIRADELRTPGIIDRKYIRLLYEACLLYTSPSPRDATLSRMPSSA